MCFDIGANIGNHSVFFREYFDRVVAVEANPSVFGLLQVNTANHANVDCLNLAVGDTKGRMSLVLSDRTNEGTGTVSHAFNEGQPDMVSFVDADTLDGIAEKFGASVDFIKIDVEGMEQAVLRGAAKTIGAHRPVILFEYHKKFQIDGDSISILRDDYGYSDFFYVAPKYDFKRFEGALWDVLHIVVNFFANSQFVVTPVKLPAGRSYEFVIAVP